MKRSALLLVLFSLTLLVGCGRKTPTVPPQAVVAQAISDLHFQVDDEGVTLTWTYPRLSVANERISNIRTFIISKASIPAADYCAGCPVVFDYQFKVDATALEPGNQVTYRDTDLAPGYHYVYLVRASSGWRVVSKPSNRITFARQHALLAPADLQVEIGDSRLTLHWSAVRHRADGSPVEDLRYQLYRSRDNKKFLPQGLATERLSYTDPTVVNGRTYFYQVRAILADAQDNMILGRPSQTAIGIPVDMTPPAPPTALVVIGRKQGVQLHWQGSPDADVAGYHIYRHDADSDWQRIASTGAGAISYADHTDLTAGTYKYRVTAFDKSVRRNESEPSATVSYSQSE